jgi:hypothetical protein
MSVIDAIGYLAAGLVAGTFCMRSMRGLHCLAIASNLAFIGYGYFGDLMPVLLLHLVLLPVNILRLTEQSSAQTPIVSERIRQHLPREYRNAPRRTRRSRCHARSHVRTRSEFMRRAQRNRRDSRVLSRH